MLESFHKCSRNTQSEIGAKLNPIHKNIKANSYLFGHPKNKQIISFIDWNDFTKSTVQMCNNAKQIFCPPVKTRLKN